MLMEASSVVRRIDFHGYRALPYRMKHQDAYQYDGRYVAAGCPPALIG